MGEFRALSTTTLASLILSAIEGVIMQWVFDEHAINLNDCRQELVALFRLYTQNTQMQKAAGDSKQQQ